VLACYQSSHWVRCNNYIGGCTGRLATCVRGTLGSILAGSVDYMYSSEPEGYEMHSMEFFYYYGNLLRLPSRVSMYFLSRCVARCGFLSSLHRLLFWHGESISECATRQCNMTITVSRWCRLRMRCTVGLMFDAVSCLRVCTAWWRRLIFLAYASSMR